MELYIAKNEQEFGPYSLDELNAKLASGELNRDDLAWFDGELDWKPLREILGDTDLSESVANDTASDDAGEEPESTENKTQRIYEVIIGIMIMTGGVWWFSLNHTDWGLCRYVTKSVREEFRKDANLADVKIDRFILLDGSGELRSGSLTCSRNGKQIVLSVAVTTTTKENGWEISGEEMLKLSSNPYLADPKTLQGITQFDEALIKLSPSLDEEDKAWEQALSASEEPKIISNLQKLFLPLAQSNLTALNSLLEPTPEARNYKNAFVEYIRLRQTVAQLLVEAYLEEDDAKVERASRLLDTLNALLDQVTTAGDAHVKSIGLDSSRPVSGGRQP